MTILLLFCKRTGIVIMKNNNPLLEFCKLGILAGLTIFTLHNCEKDKAVNEIVGSDMCDSVTTRDGGGFFGLVYELEKRHDASTTITISMASKKPNNIYIDARDKSISPFHRNTQVLNLYKLRTYSSLTGDIKTLVSCFEYQQKEQRYKQKSVIHPSLRGLKR